MAYGFVAVVNEAGCTSTVIGASPRPIMCKALAAATLIFDEVDAGLGGRAAATVAAKLRELAKHYLVVVISHLPQMLSTALAATLEAELGDGPYFDGARFCMVDAVFGPVFRYFDVFDTIDAFGVLDDLPNVGAWRHALAARPSVRDAVSADYAARLRTFLLTRGSALSRRTVAGTVN